jgi:hypothetical protein
MVEISDVTFSMGTANAQYAQYLYNTIHNRQHLARDVALPQGQQALLLHNVACCLGYTPVL